MMLKFSMGTLVPSTIIFSVLTTVFLIALCRDGLSEPEEVVTPAVQEPEPLYTAPSFSTEDLEDWQRQPGRIPAYSKQHDTDKSPAANPGPDPDARIAIVSMPYGESVHPVYDDAIGVMERYAVKHGYESYLLKQGITSNCAGLPVDCNSVDRKNLGGAWNKMLYLVNIITQELTKPKADRLDWIMWQQADATLIINPLVPLHIFLPPRNHPLTSRTFALLSKDHNGLNNGVFFLRVHETSLKFLIAMLSMPVWKPDLDLGWYFEQGAMANLAERSPWKEGIVWQPKHWWNTYDFEVKRGSLLMHMPGQTDGERVPKMSEWLDKIKKQEKWAVDVDKLPLKKVIEEFWKRLETKGEEKPRKKSHSQ